jgi:hypothetical protein
LGPNKKKTGENVYIGRKVNEKRFLDIVRPYIHLSMIRKLGGGNNE